MANPRTAAELLDLIERFLLTLLQLSDGFEREKALALIQAALASSVRTRPTDAPTLREPSMLFCVYSSMSYR